MTEEKRKQRLHQMVNERAALNESDFDKSLTLYEGIDKALETEFGWTKMEAVEEHFLQGSIDSEQLKRVLGDKAAAVLEAFGENEKMAAPEPDATAGARKESVSSAQAQTAPTPTAPPVSMASAGAYHPKVKELADLLQSGLDKQMFSEHSIDPIQQLAENIVASSGGEKDN